MKRFTLINLAQSFLVGIGITVAGMNYDMVLEFLLGGLAICVVLFILGFIDKETY